MKFPVFVRLRDCGIVRQYSSVHELQYDFEKIDVENDEYEAWDANAVPLSLSVQRADVWVRLEASSTTSKPEELADAIKNYAANEGIEIEASASSTNEFIALLAKVKDAITNKWQSQSWWERFKRRFSI